LVDTEPSAEVRDFKVWDLSIRVFHWSLAILIFFLWQTGENGSLDTHRKLGLAVLGLLIYRLYWGFFGPKTARFTAYPIKPGQIFRYIPTLFKKPYNAGIGHNPLASLSVIAILGVLLFQVGTGLFSIDTDGLSSGYFAHLVDFGTGRDLAKLHETSFNVITALIFLHLFAIGYYAIGLATNLVTAMITGTRDVDAHSAAQATPATLNFAQLGLAVMFAMIGVSAVLHFGR